MHVAQAIVVVPVTGWVDECRQGFGPLLHEQSRNGPVGFASVKVVGEEHAVGDFVGFRVTDRKHDVFNKPTVTGGVDSVDFCGYVVPVVGDRFNAPVFTAERVQVVVSELINIDFSGVSD